MRKLLFFFAIAGWTLGLTVHVLSIIDIDVTEQIPFVWLLHIGIFVVWLPAVLQLKNNQELIEFQKSGILNRMKPWAFWKIVFKETPTWIVIIAMVGFFYAGINFFLFITSQIGVPEIKNGQFILQNHGTLVKTLTEQEYHHYKANQVRGFSGHWILFYGMAAAILYPFGKMNNNEMSVANSSL